MSSVDVKFHHNLFCSCCFLNLLLLCVTGWCFNWHIFCKLIVVQRIDILLSAGWRHVVLLDILDNQFGHNIAEFCGVSFSYARQVSPLILTLQMSMLMAVITSILLHAFGKTTLRGDQSGRLEDWQPSFWTTKTQGTLVNTNVIYFS